MAPTEHRINEAAARLAHTASFPTFTGGWYAFVDPTLADGAWFPAGSQNPLLSLAYAVVSVPPPDGDYFVLTQTRCRIAIEDAITRAEQELERP
jgi:hypothetical protein